MATVCAAVVHFKLVQEIDQERELLRALMENIPDPIYFKDCQSRFTRVNQAHARNLGSSRTPRSAWGRAMRTISNPKTPCAGRCRKKIS